MKRGNNMKIFKRISAALLAVCAAMLLFACSPAREAFATLKESTQERVVLVADRTSEGSLADALRSLAEEDSSFSFEGTESEYGLFITSVNGRTAGEGEFWAIYTTLKEYEGVTYSDAAWGTAEYGGKTLASASFGADGLPMVEGELYALVLSSY